MRNRHKSKTFEQLTIIDTAAKGKTVAKTDEGIPIFLMKECQEMWLTLELIKSEKAFLKGK